MDRRIKVGLVGWRGMVGRVLLERMSAEGDWQGLLPTFFSTSQVGDAGPEVPGLEDDGEPAPLKDAWDLAALRSMDIIISCQGSDYTKKMHGSLRRDGFQGFWLDAASCLRMDDSATIVLDPINGDRIKDAIKAGKRDFIGGNCTVSLMLMALWGLLQDDAVEHLSAITYQAASGAGAQAMTELLEQFAVVGSHYRRRQGQDILAIEAELNQLARGTEMPADALGVPLVASLIPWIDSEMSEGQTKEEWKGAAEAERILGRPLIMDSTCVRVGVLRCHSQAIVLKLRRPMDVETIQAKLRDAHPWVRLIPNERGASCHSLTPTAVSGTLDIAVGRVRRFGLDNNHVSLFTVGDQLLWGAAEPIRRCLNLVREFVTHEKPARHSDYMT